MAIPQEKMLVEGSDGYNGAGLSILRTDHAEELSDAFKLNLTEHELKDPAFNRGSVASYQSVPSTDINNVPLGCTVYEATTIDPFIEADPECFKLVNQYVRTLESRMLEEGYDPFVMRTEATDRTQRGRFTQAWLGDQNVEGLSIWRDLVPTAEALGYLTNPWVGSIIENRNGVVGIISRETAAQLRFVDDAIGIRDRGVVMEKLAGDHLAKLSADGVTKAKWLSLASGTAEPAIAAAKNVTDATGLSVDLTVADWDKKSLRYVNANAAKYGFEGSVHTVQANILSDNLAKRLEDKTNQEALYDVVENMGFEEYLPQEGDEMAAFKGQGLPQASEFTRNAYKLVKPGGVLLSGNMVLHRSQIDFVFGCVDWPLINARSEQSILRVYEEAGILDDPKSKVELIRVKNEMTGTHIYDIVMVTKLAE